MFYVVDRQTAFSRKSYKALSFAVSKAGKEEIVLKPDCRSNYGLYVTYMKGERSFCGFQQHLANLFVMRCYRFSLTASRGSLKAAL